MISYPSVRPLFRMLAAGLLLALFSCQKDGLQPAPHSSVLAPTLSDYRIWEGDPKLLVPAEGYELLELASELFTDYAEKQRLIRLPPGTGMEASGDALLHFPEGTVLVKTFYYFRDKREPAKGKRLLETRLLIREEGRWHTGTYRWNEEQSEAFLLTTGSDALVNWIDDQGNPRVISYRIPGTRECVTCHSSYTEIVPIGPKLRNLNRTVIRKGQSLNQLAYLRAIGLLGDADPAAFGSLPDYRDGSLPLEHRARAYLEVNCAHCHSQGGDAAHIRYRLGYGIPLEQSKIREGKQLIGYFMEKGLMPKIGTTVVDEQGLELIRQYLSTL